MRRLLVALALLPPAVLWAQPAPPPEAERIGENLYRVGKVRVDLKARAATCAGKVNMQKGLIEYLAVGYEGKRHESLLTLDVRPLHLQVGLILLGLEPGGGLERQGDTALPRGPAVDITVGWRRAGRDVRVPAADLVWDVDRKAPLARAAWVFSGSLVDKRGFLADREHSLIATYRDPGAIVNNVLPSGADDTALKVNERIAPPIGTAVTLTLSPAAPPATARR
jgi:hypothetical protein